MSPLPSEMGRFSSTKWFILTNNPTMLEHSIPSEFGQLGVNLQVPHLGETNLSGSIPSELGKLTNLEGLWLNQNNIQGSLPKEFQWLPKLELLNISGNSLLSGTIPENLCTAVLSYDSFGWENTTELLAAGFDCSSLLCGCECSCSPVNGTYA